MPPADNAQTPTPPAPQPEQPKQGFFAKLFGKKPKETPIVPPAESHTPPPELDDNVSRETPTPDASSAAPTTDAGAPPSADLGANPPVVPPSEPAASQPVPTVKADEDAPTLAVPDSLKAQGVDADDVNTSPSLATQPPAAGEHPSETPPADPTAPAQPSNEEPKQ